MRRKNEFSTKTKEALARRVNYRCSMPTCRQPTRGPRTGQDLTVSIGMAAHITAASPGGARYDPVLTPAQRRSAANGIWMCQNHGKLVDNDAARYPVDLLREWKSAAESDALQPSSNPSVLL